MIAKNRIVRANFKNQILGETTMTKPEVKRTELIAAAKELNTLLDPDPKIKTVAIKTDALIDAIKVAAALIEAGDGITEATNDLLLTLGVELPEGVEITETEEPEQAEEKAEEEEATVEAKEISLEDLIFLAKEMNDIMKLAPAIETKEEDFDTLKAVILENCYENKECQIYDTDEFTEDSWATLRALGVVAVSEMGDLPVKKDAGKDKKTGKAEKPAKVDKTEKIENQPKKEKPAKVKEKVEKATETPPAAKKEAEGYTRSHALVDALKAVSGTREEIVALSDKFFVEKGGKTNPNVANYMFGYVLPSLKIIGTVAQEGKIFTWK